MYRPNAVARSLTVHRGASIAVWLSDIATASFPRWSERWSFGRTGTAGQSRSATQERIRRPRWSAWRCSRASRQEGAVAMGLMVPPAPVGRYLKTGTRTVTLDRSSSLREIVFVQADHCLARDPVTTHLIGPATAGSLTFQDRSRSRQPRRDAQAT